MNKIKFNLNLKSRKGKPQEEEKPKKRFQKKVTKSEVLIMMVYRHPKGTLKYSTGEKVTIDNWNPNRQRSNEQTSFLRGKLINSNLDRLERNLNDIITGFNQRSEIPSNDMLREKLDIIFRGREPNPGKINDLQTWIELFLTESQNRIMPNSFKVYQTTKRYVDEWLEKRKLTFSELTNQHYKEFTDFLRDHDLIDSTVGKYIKTLKTFINAAVEDERTTASTNPINNKKLGITNNESDQVFLNENELKQILKLRFGKDHSLERIRDAFIIGCYTGLRISDLKQLKPRNIVSFNNGKIISLVPVKTGQRVEIPLKPIVEKLLTKQKFLLLTTTEKNMNERLKEIGKLAGINDQFTKRIYKMGKPVEYVYEKWELISTHTGRRSFVTNALIANIPPYAVMKMTGHRTLKSFETYIRFTERDNALKLLGNKFFK